MAIYKSTTDLEKEVGPLTQQSGGLFASAGGQTFRLTGQGYEPASASTPLKEPSLINTDNFRLDAQANVKKLEEQARAIKANIDKLAEKERMDKAAGLSVEQQQRLNDLVVSGVSRDEAIAKVKTPAGVFTDEERAALGITEGDDEQAVLLKRQAADFDRQQQEIQSKLDNLAVRADENAAAMINSIQGRYSERRRQMEDINKRSVQALEQIGIRGGAGRRSASFAGIVSAEERAGLDRLTELDREEQELILNANEAARSAKYDVLAKTMDNIESKREQINKQLIEFNKATIEKNKEISDAAKAKQDLDESFFDLQMKKIEAIAPYISELLTGDSEIDNSLLAQIAENQGYSPEFLAGEVQRYKQEQSNKLLTEDYRNFLLQGGKSGDTAGFKAFRESKKTTPEEVGGLSASQIAKNIMESKGTYTISDVPTNMRGSVQEELVKLRETTKENGDIIGLIRSSAGGKQVSDSWTQSFEKALNVIDQLGGLKNAISDTALDPITGIIRSKNPYDKKATLIKARLQALVPNLARGIYGEVGVLTDTDIANYAKTLPNLKTTNEIADALLGITVLSVQRSIENKLKTQANSGRDISGFEDTYVQVKDLADSLSPTNKIRVKEKATGRTGTIDKEEFDESKYEKIE